MAWAIMPPRASDFSDDLALGDAADGRVAAHLGDGVEVVGEEGRLGAHACGGEGGLAAGVACSDNDDVVLIDDSAHRIHLRERPARAARAAGQLELPLRWSGSLPLVAVSFKL